MDELLPEIGTPMFLLGRLCDWEDVHRNTFENAVALFQILRHCGLYVPATERQVEVSLNDQTTLGGLIDLELTTDDGQTAIADLKWSNSDRYCRAEISEARVLCRLRRICVS